MTNPNQMYLRLKWWQRPAYIASIAGLIFSLSFVVFAFKTVTNSEALDAIKHNQESIDIVVGVIQNLCNSDDSLKETICKDIPNQTKEG